jgi:hypothetical protein
LLLASCFLLSVAPINFYCGDKKIPHPIIEMSSVSRGYSARITNRFVANGNVDTSGVPGEFTGAWLVQFASMIPVLAYYNPKYDQPYVNLKCKFVSFNNVSDLVGGLIAVWYNVDTATQPYETLIDMGREIKFGVLGGQMDLVTFRIVQRTNGSASNNGVGGEEPSHRVGNDMGFNTYLVPIENRLSGDELAGVFPVQVSRV